MTTVVENPPSVAGLFQYHNVIGLLSGSGPGFSGPVSLALGRDGLLYVASRANPNQPEGVRVTRCTFEGDYVGEFSNWAKRPDNSSGLRTFVSGRTATCIYRMRTPIASACSHRKGSFCAAGASSEQTPGS